MLSTFRPVFSRAIGQVAVAASLILAGVATAAATGVPAPAPPSRTITVYKSPTCMCCGKWIEHLRAAGFTVVTKDVTDPLAVKRANHVPAAAGSCHTGVIGGYAFEGHVPADLIEKVLAEKPAIAGLAAPGMPASAPGMDMPGPKQAYDVVQFTADGATSLYAKR